MLIKYSLAVKGVDLYRALVNLYNGHSFLSYYYSEIHTTMDLDSFSFIYQHIEYKAIVRTKTIEEATEYHITIMNGELEKMLYGHHILIEKFGNLFFRKEGSGAMLELQNSISSALSNYLKSVSFA